MRAMLLALTASALILPATAAAHHPPCVEASASWSDAIPNEFLEARGNATPYGEASASARMGVFSAEARQSCPLPLARHQDDDEVHHH